MCKEQYVSDEIAKLLKEKGFPQSTSICNVVYKPNGKMSFNAKSFINPYYIFKDCYIFAPTQQMACRWLREVHKIDISVTPDDGSWWIKVTELESWSSVFNGKVLNSDDIKYAYEGDTSTKEGCYEAGLWYVLKNLI